MKKTNQIFYILTSIALATSTLAPALSFEAKKFTGELKTISPKASVNPEDEYIAGVTSQTIKAITNNNICELVGSKAQALEGLSATGSTCHFEWLPHLEGFTQDGLVQAGVFPGPGQYSLPYRVSVYSSHRAEKINVYEGSENIHVGDADGPSIESVLINWTTEQIAGFEQFIGNPDESIRNIKVNVDPKPYNQILSFEGDNRCIIPANEESCTITVGGRQFNNENLSGTEGVPIIIDSADSEYFNASKDINIEWDYRPPTFNRMVHNLNAGDDGSPITITSGKTSYQLKPEHVAVVFDSVQTDKAGEWWQPKNKVLNLEKDQANYPTNSAEILGRLRYFNIPFFDNAPNTRIQIKDLVILDGQILYVYDPREVADSRYNITINTRNWYGQGEDAESEPLTLSRFPPAIAFFNSRAEIKTEGSLYFPNDIVIAAHGGWNDGSRISEVHIDGVAVELKGDDQQKQFTAQALEGLVPGESYEVTAFAVDNSGNESARTVTLHYAHSSHIFMSTPADVFRGVEPINVRVRQAKGMACQLTTSAELAIELATPFSHSCYVDWIALPEGLEAYATGRNAGMRGVITTNQPTTTAEFNIVYYNSDGESVRIPGQRIDIDLREPQAIDLGLIGREENASGEILVPYATRRIATIPMAFNRGVVDYEIIVGSEETPYVSRSISTKHEQIAGSIRANYDPKVEFELYKRDTLTVRAWYRYRPEMKTEITKPTILMPLNSYRFKLEANENSGHTQEQFTFDTTIQMNTPDGWQYSAETGGDFMVHLATYTSEGYEAITPEQPMTGDGVRFVVDANESLKAQTNIIVAIGTLQNDVESGNKEIRSNNVGLSLLSGDAVKGELQSHTIEGAIPLGVAVSFKPATRGDAAVTSNIRWEKRVSGSSEWVHLKNYDGNYGFRDSLIEPEVYDLRVRVENVMTGVETISETVTVIGYEVQRVSITGNSRNYANLPGAFGLRTREKPLKEADGIFMWSLDGTNWEEGGAEYVVTRNQNFTVHARFRFHQTSELVGEDGWMSTSTRVSVTEPAPVRLGATIPSYAEVGTSFELAGVARANMRGFEDLIVMEWEAASGEKLENNSTYVVKEGDLNEENAVVFTFRAWLPGLKEETYSETSVSTRPWKYNVPDMSIVQRNSHRIAPVNVRMYVSHSTIFAPGITWDYEWDLPEGAELNRELRDGREVIISFEEPGVYMLNASFSDSRGNTVPMQEFIEILEPVDIEPVSKIRYSEPFMRPPLSAVMQLTASRTHPDDRLETIEWFLNGESIGEDSRYGRFDIEEVGTHVMTGVMRTVLGQEASVSETVVVAPNKPPVCNPEVTNRGTSFTVNTNCTDEDGKISRYEWSWNGEDHDRPRNNYLRFTNIDPEESFTVKFRAYDDSGDYDEHTVTLTSGN